MRGGDSKEVLGFLMSGVTDNATLLKRLMKIDSNPPIITLSTTLTNLIMLKLKSNRFRFTSGMVSSR